MAHFRQAVMLVLLATCLLTVPTCARLLMQSTSAEASADSSAIASINGDGQASASSSGQASATSGGHAEADGTATSDADANAAATDAGQGSATAGATAQADVTTVNVASGLFGGERYQGDGTAYSETVPNTGANFACSYRYLNDWASTHFAAINIHQWDNGNACGRCATARCVDPQCATQNKDVTVMIVDQCPECAHGDMDFSIPVYRDITGMWPHRLRVEWEWSDCSPHINGTIKVSPKDGSNPYWRAFYFSNFKHPLKTAYLNGQEMPRSQFQFFQHSGSLQNTNTFELEAVTGERVTATVGDPMREQDLGVQFAA